MQRKCGEHTKIKLHEKKIAKKTYDPPQLALTPTCLLWIGNVAVTTMTTITNYVHCMKYHNCYESL